MKECLLKVLYLLPQSVPEGLYFTLIPQLGKSSTIYLNSDSTLKSVIGTGLQSFIDLLG